MALSVKKGGSTLRPVTLPMVVSIRFDEVTTGRLTKIASEHGINVSDVVRVMVEEKIDHPSPNLPVRRRVPDGVVLRDILANLGKIGSNVNQLARVANTTKQIEPDTFERCLRDLRTIASAIRAVIGGTLDP